MLQFKKTYLLYGIIVLTIIGIILISNYVEKAIEKPINDTEINNIPEKGNETTPISTSEQINRRLIKWTKENGIRTSGISSSTIIKDNKYWMYYTGEGIELVTSTDGLNFSNREDVIKNGPIGSGQEMVTNPTVFKLFNGSYRMIYEGARLDEEAMKKGEFHQTDRKLYSAISTDGKKWIKEDGVRFWDYGDGKPGEIFTSVPDIIRLPDDRLRMYYTRGSTSAIALSNDEGLTWTKETDLKLGKVAIDPDIVLLDNNTYKLFFTTFEDEFGIGKSWIMSASSIDGINFAVDEEKLIESGTAESMGTCDSDVIKTNNGYRIYYGEFIEVRKGEYESNIMSAFSSE